MKKLSYLLVLLMMFFGAMVTYKADAVTVNSWNCEKEANSSIITCTLVAGTTNTYSLKSFDLEFKPRSSYVSFKEIKTESGWSYSNVSGLKYKFTSDKPFRGTSAVATVTFEVASGAPKDADCGVNYEPTNEEKIRYYCSLEDGVYYGPSGAVVDKATYDSVCGQDKVCKAEKVGSSYIYYGKDGSQVSQLKYLQDCHVYTCQVVLVNGVVGNSNGYRLYLGKDGTEVSADTYYDECGTHVCAVYTATDGSKYYYGKNGTKVTQAQYNGECICAMVDGVYYDKNGNINQYNYEEQCLEHKCEYFHGKYYGKNGEIVSNENEMKKACGLTHACEQDGSDFYDNKGNKVTEAQYKEVCFNHVCEVVNGHYYGKNGLIVNEVTYHEECDAHVCKQVGNYFYGKDGKIVSEVQYKKECENKKYVCEEADGKFYNRSGVEVSEAAYHEDCDNVTHVCEIVSNKYYGKDGVEVKKEVYYEQCSSYVCKSANGYYYGKDGKIVSEAVYKEQCANPQNFCKIVNNVYYDKTGKVVSKDEYYDSCGIKNPGTGEDNIAKFAFLGIVLVIGMLFYIRKHNVMSKI